MKRCFLTITWDIVGASLRGPFDTAADARATLAEDETVDPEHAAVLGPIPVLYLSEEPEALGDDFEKLLGALTPDKASDELLRREFLRRAPAGA